MIVFAKEKKFGPLGADLERFARSSLRLVRLGVPVRPKTRGIFHKKSSFEVYLIDNRTMKRLNTRFKKKVKPTNVLSFPTGDFPNPNSEGFLGEIYLAPDYIHKKREDIFRLFVHGLIHLLGYTHGRPRDRIEMERKEALFMESLETKN